MWSFVIALVHFISETLVYKTAKLGAGMISPLIVACKFTSSFLSLPGLIVADRILTFLFSIAHQPRVSLSCISTTATTSGNLRSQHSFKSQQQVSTRHWLYIMDSRIVHTLFWKRHAELVIEVQRSEVKSKILERCNADK